MFDEDNPIDPEWQKECCEKERQLDIDFRCFLPELSESQQNAINTTAQKLHENVIHITENVGYRATGHIVEKGGMIEDVKITNFEVVNGDLAK